MKIFFSNNFKKELSQLGNTIRLSKVRLGKYQGNNPKYQDFIDNTVLGKYMEFKSLWNKEEKVLTMTLDLSNLSEEYVQEWVTPETCIFTYYSDLSDNIKDLAFILTGNLDGNQVLPLNLCTFGKEHTSSKPRRDLNYINITFPSATVANIDTKLANTFTALLENPGNTIGHNTYLVGDLVGDDVELSKETFYKYLRHQISLRNDKPLFLNGNGEKVFENIYYRYYKSINIQAYGLVSVGDPSGNYFYYVDRGSSTSIVGSVVYDLYQEVNGTYILLKSNLLEDLSNVKLEQDEEVEGVSSYTLDQIKKTITFKPGSKGSAKIVGTLSFKDEVGDQNGQIIKLRSNTLEFTTHQRWSVDYPTRFTNVDETTGISYPILVLDANKDSGLWDAIVTNSGEDISTDSSNKYIAIYSEHDVAIDSISVKADTPENQYLFDNYFNVQVKKAKYDVVLERYKYEVLITTKRSTKEVKSPVWYPMKVEGDTRVGVLFLNTICVGDVSCEDSEAAKFYCIQRPYYPLRLGKLEGNDLIEVEREVRFPGIEGFKEQTGYYIIGGGIPGYDCWESIESEEYEDLSGHNLDNCLLDYKTNNVVTKSTFKEEDVLSFYTSATPHTRRGTGTGAVLLGGYSIRRRNSSTKSFDPSYWKDLIYCSRSNGLEIIVSMDKSLKDNDRWSLMYDTGEEGLRSFYVDENNNSYDLFLFNRNEVKSVSYLITNRNPSLIDLDLFSQGKSPVKVKIDDEYKSLLNPHFTFRVTGEKKIINGAVVGVSTVTITCISSGSGIPIHKWYPSVERNFVDVPIPIKIVDSDINNNRTFYCVIKPKLEGTIKIFDTNPDNLVEIKDHRFESQGGTKLIYIASTIGRTGEFDNWIVHKKDLEISVNQEGLVGSQRIITEPIKNIANWEKNGEPKTLVSTQTKSPDLQEYHYDSLVIRRAAGSYTSKVDYYRDWKNYLVQDSWTKLKLKQAGMDYSKTLSIYTADINNVLKLLPIGKPLELGYIGLYKLFIKSTSKFRITLSHYNEEDRFYFFDTSNNVPKIGTKMLESFDNDVVTGKEVCFAFYGNEKRNFENNSQILRTKIRVENIVDGSKFDIPIKRTYFLTNNSGGKINNIETNLRIISPDNDYDKAKVNRAFIQSSKGEDISFGIISYAEVDAKFTTIGGYLGTSDKVGKSILVNLDSKTYSTLGSYTDSLGNTSSVPTRGNINQVLTCNFKNVQLPEAYNHGYPLAPLGQLQIENPKNYNSERKNIQIYRLKPRPTVSWVTTGTPIHDGSITLSYKASQEIIIRVLIGKGGKYRLLYQEDGQGNWDKFVGYQKVSKTGKFKITRSHSDDLEGAIAYKIRENSGSDWNGEGDSKIGNIKVESYVDHNEFLLDLNKEPIDFSGDAKYTQDYVDTVVPRAINEPTPLGIVRKNKNSTSLSELSGNTSPIKKEGEFRLYYLHIKDGDSVDLDTSLDLQSDFIEEMHRNQATDTLGVLFKSRLKRNDYNPLKLRYSFAPGVGTVLDDSSLTEICKYSRDFQDTSFFVRTNREDLTLSQVQENWQTGLKIDNNLYLGENEVSLSVPHDKTSITLWVAPVQLPTDVDALANTLTTRFELSTLGPKITGATLGYDLSEVPNDPKNQSKSYGYKLVVYLPLNGGTEPLYPSFTISDVEGLNSVTCKITIKPRPQYKVEAFSRYEKINGQSESDTYLNVSSGDRLKDLVFSSSGYLYNPNKTLYVITDAPEAECSFELNTIITDTDPSSDLSGIHYSFDNRIEPNSDGKYFIGMCRVDNRGDKLWRLYKLTLYSKINTVIKTLPDVNSGELLKLPGQVPFKGNCTLSLPSMSGSGHTMKGYYGACNITIAPIPTYRSCQLYTPNIPEGSSGELTRLPQPENFTTCDYGQVLDPLESRKYSNSNFRSGTKQRSPSTYDLRPIINIDYREDPNYETYKRFWESWGYTAAFSIEVDRKEWRLVGGAYFVIDDMTHPSNTRIRYGNPQNYFLHLVDTEETTEKTIYKDDYEIDLTGHKRRLLPDNPKTIHPKKTYHSTYNGHIGTSTCFGIDLIEIGDNRCKTILFVSIPANHFKTKEGVLVSEEITLNISQLSKSNDVYTADNVYFKVNISLHNII